MMLLSSGLGVALIVAATSVSIAGNVNVTPDLRQKAQLACTSDAMRLCPGSIGDEGQIVACMREQRAQLTTPCRQVYDQVARALKQPSAVAARNSGEFANALNPTAAATNVVPTDGTVVAANTSDAYRKPNGALTFVTVTGAANANVNTPEALIAPAPVDADCPSKAGTATPEWIAAKAFVGVPAAVAPTSTDTRLMTSPTSTGTATATATPLAAIAAVSADATPNHS